MLTSTARSTDTLRDGATTPHRHGPLRQNPAAPATHKPGAPCPSSDGPDTGWLSISYRSAQEFSALPQDSPSAAPKNPKGARPTQRRRPDRSFPPEKDRHAHLADRTCHAGSYRSYSYWRRRGSDADDQRRSGQHQYQLFGPELINPRSRGADRRCMARRRQRGWLYRDRCRGRAGSGRKQRHAHQRARHGGVSRIVGHCIGLEEGHHSNRARLIEPRFVGHRRFTDLSRPVLPDVCVAPRLRSPTELAL